MFSCWGTNAGGQLGNGDDTAADQAMPGVLGSLPAPLRTIAAGAYHTCALLETGAVMCWGNNDAGACGVPSSAPLFHPVAVPALASGVIGLGAGAGAQHTCAILRDGSVECWGNDDEGQLGSGATTEDSGRSSATPLPVRW
jgi:alpha-tubulin suppressor-like RCC1 family protein